MSNIKVEAKETEGTNFDDVITGRDDGEINSRKIGEGDTITAGDGDDIVYGGAENEFITGGAGNDILMGGKGRDELRGDDGDDMLMGGAGNDIINGGGGVDTGVFSGNYADYEITDPDSGWKRNFLVIRDTREGSPDGTDFIQKQFTEKLQFTDGIYDIATKTFKNDVYDQKVKSTTTTMTIPLEGADVYSTEETLTNKIFKGKPVYRKIVEMGDLSHLSGKSTSDWITVSFGIDDVVDELISSQRFGDWTTIYDCVWSSHTKVRSRCRVNKKGFHFKRAKYYQEFFENVNFIIEYTKK